MPKTTVQFLFTLLFVSLQAITPASTIAGGQEPINSEIKAGEIDSLGAKIYASKCASCHGDSGEGNPAEFEDALYGDRSVGELAKYISETMPEEDPDACVGEDAKQVAQFVFDSFYSKAAQQRLNQSRIELSRLTVRQYRESIADLVGSFSAPLWNPKERGLRADYFGSRYWNEKRRLSKQIDPVIDFASGIPHFDPSGNYVSLKKTKKPKNLAKDGFSAHWSGSLIAPETGEYEIIVESKNGFVLHLNDEQHPLIDRRVQSDALNDHSEKIFLLGGRIYQFKLELAANSNPPAKVRLLWKPPEQRKAVVPNSCLTPHWTPEVAIVSTKFPPDDASFGFERGISVSQQWDAATTEASIETANWIADRIHRLAGTKANDEKSTEKIKAFCSQFASRAFCKQLNEDEQRFFVDQHFEQELSITDQVKRVVILTLKSPRFLFPSLQQRETNQELIRRMALCLWDSAPDQQLHKLAHKGKLTRTKTMSEQLSRMVDDPRAKAKLQTFFHHWLESHQQSISKDKELYPKFNDQVASDLKTSLNVFLNGVVWSGKSDFRQLFLADYLFLNERLADFYQLDFDNIQKPNDGSAVPLGFKKVKADPLKRAGILTHPYLMAGLAYHKDSSPIHRGVFVAKRVLGRQLRQPPNDVEPLPDDFNPTLTTRERVEHQTKSSSCMNCHSIINPLGFSLENFDAVGRFRTEEKKKSIDVSTVYSSSDGETITLEGPRDLATFLAHNEMAQRSFIRQLFNHYSKQSIDAYGTHQLDQLHSKFVANNYNVKNLLIDITKAVIQHGITDRD